MAIILNESDLRKFYKKCENSQMNEYLFEEISTMWLTYFYDVYDELHQFGWHL